jgi:hypothetical protein
MHAVPRSSPAPSTTCNPYFSKPRHLTPAWFLTMAYLDNGKPEQARALLGGMRREFEKNCTWRHAWAILIAANGKREEALQAMDEGTLG